MKTTDKNKTFYKVCIYTDVYLDSYEQGEKEHVNFYESNFEIEHYTPLNAIHESFINLGFTFYERFAQIETEINGKQVLYYSHLCDVENIEIEETSTLIKDFSDGKINLYSNHHTVKVYKLTESNIY